MRNLKLRAILKTPPRDLSKFILGFKFNNAKVFLIVLFTLLYLPHCFVLNEDLGLITAHDVDSGSILRSITGLMDNYNFHDHFHSRYYGWTYFTINIIVLTPIKIFLDIFKHEDSLEILIFSAKLLFFLIGLFSVILFNEVLLKIFRNKLYALLGSLSYMAGSLGSIFYNIHPETTGLLFMFSGILTLLNFLDDDNKSEKLYFYGLIFLVLSSLSKQTFFFTSLPILGIFIYAIFIKEKIKFVEFITSKKFTILSGKSILLVLLTLLIINPFLIFDFKNAISYQIQLVEYQNKDDLYLRLLSSKGLFYKWIELILSIPVALLYFISLPLTIVVTIFSLKKYKNKKYCDLFLIMTLSVCFIFLIIALGNRLYILGRYLAPIYPFFIINTLVLIKYLNSGQAPGKAKLIKTIALFILVPLYVISLTRLTYYTVYNSVDRYMNYKETRAFKSYKYILNNFDEKDKIIHDQFVGMPDSLKNNSCNYWLDHFFEEGDCLKEIDPDYIIIDKRYKINDRSHTRLTILLDYIEKNNMVSEKEISEIMHTHFLTVRDHVATVSFYKKPRKDPEIKK